MADILDIQSGLEFDESVSHYEIHAHHPYTSLNFNNSDEIRISIQHQDLNLLPSRSCIHVIGRLIKSDAKDATPFARTALVNNAICHLFEEIRYELNAIEIDRCKNVGVTSVIKGWPSFNPNQKIILENAGWLCENGQNIVKAAGYFDIFIPLNMILGFAEDYRKIVVNMKHELVLSRSRTDLNAVVQTATARDNPTYEGFKIELLKIEWLMPYIQLSTQYKIRLLRQIEKSKPLSISFRSWELYEYPTLPTSTKHVWTVKTSNQLEKPRFVILGFQTNRKNQNSANASLFDHCNLSEVKLFLNSQYYPYGSLNIDIDRNQFAILYDMFANFQQSYYGKNSEPLLTKANFINNVPLIVIDCSRQNDSLKNEPVDVRLEFESKNNFPENTSAYCLILHDRVVEYNAVSGDVRKLM